MAKRVGNMIEMRDLISWIGSDAVRYSLTRYPADSPLSLDGEVTQSRLGEILAIDSTTLTRTLEIMDREGWIAERRGEDRRERWLRLAKAGEAQFKLALPAWEKVQSRLRRQLGDEAWKGLLDITQQITGMVTTH